MSPGQQFKMNSYDLVLFSFRVSGFNSIQTIPGFYLQHNKDNERFKCTFEAKLTNAILRRILF